MSGRKIGYPNKEISILLNIDKNVKLDTNKLRILIVKYIKEKDLQNKENERNIDIHKQEAIYLKKALKIPDNYDLNFLNLGLFLLRSIHIEISR
jgi:hypothetical protein